MERFTDASGAEVWVPVTGKSASFSWLANLNKGPEYDREPIVSGSAAAVQGSGQVNRPLPDSAFSAAGRSLLPETASLKWLRDRFRAERERQRAELKTDPASVSAELDRRLKEADRQAEELTASAPSRSWPVGMIALQATLCAVGVAFLVFAYRRSSLRRH